MLTELQILQQRRLEEIGGYLRQIRQGQEISSESVEHQTRIQKNQLAAIERGDVRTLPQTVYLQGFIKLYANFLKCDGSVLAATFPTELSTQEQRDL